MPYFARLSYPVSGTDYNVTFPYLDKTHVKVYVDDVLQTSGAAYTWHNATTIRFSPAPSGTTVLIKRETSHAARLVNWTAPGAMSEEDLDDDSLQAFYLGQEVIDIARDVETQMTELVLASGNVPSPLLGDVGKFLKATGAGTFAWDVVSLASASITDATTIGKAILTASDASAVRTLLSLGALATKNTVATADIDAGAVTAAKLANTAVAPGSYTNTNLTVDAQGRITAAASGSLGTGEANTASNVGAGTGVFKDKNGVDLRFKSINLSLTNADSGAGTILSNAVLSGSVTSDANNVYINLTLTRTWTAGGGGGGS